MTEIRVLVNIPVWPAVVEAVPELVPNENPEDPPKLMILYYAKNHKDERRPSPGNEYIQTMFDR